MCSPSCSTAHGRVLSRPVTRSRHRCSSICTAVLCLRYVQGLLRLCYKALGAEERGILQEGGSRGGRGRGHGRALSWPPCLDANTRADWRSPGLSVRCQSVRFSHREASTLTRRITGSAGLFSSAFSPLHPFKNPLLDGKRARRHYRETSTLYRNNKKEREAVLHSNGTLFSTTTTATQERLHTYLAALRTHPKHHPHGQRLVARGPRPLAQRVLPVSSSGMAQPESMRSYFGLPLSRFAAVCRGRRHNERRCLGAMHCVRD